MMDCVPLTTEQRLRRYHDSDGQSAPRDSVEGLDRADADADAAVGPVPYFS